MNAIIKTTTNKNFKAIVYLLDDIEQMEKIKLKPEEIEYIKRCHEDSKDKIVHINRFKEHLYFIFLNEDEEYLRLEACRKSGAVLSKNLNEHHFEEVLIIDIKKHDKELLATAEGMALANYQFNKYKTEPKDNSLKTIYLKKNSVSFSQIEEMNIGIEATLWARDLVNEPVNHLNAENLADVISKKIRNIGGHAEVLNKNKIEALKMGGLLAVNAGSVDEPTFTILEWNPNNKINERPVVLVGKGIVFDTGGYNLKTSTYMNNMKDDMSGAATVSAVVYGVAKAKLPVHVIALVPATDNRINGNAHVSGDVITMFDGTTVEVLNTDAEGRLILADALAYAKKFNPMAVFDFATLTGAASYAIGPVATVVMEKDADEIYNHLEKYGFEVYERLVKFPLWSEYGELIKSDVADLKNIGGNYAGSITAGKFLEHFTDYPWVHFDIAGPAFLEKAQSYRGEGATGIHVRLLMKYFIELTK